MRTSALIGAAIAAFFIFRSANAQAAQAVDDTDEQLPGLADEGNAFPYTYPDVLYQGQNRMTKNFSLDEFTVSKTAEQRGIDNSLPPELIPQAEATLDMLENIRSYLSELAGKDIPIFIQSGYRSPELNAAVGGAKNSDHVKAKAIDFRAPAFGSPIEIAKALEPQINFLGVAQLINEYPDGNGWVHVSTKAPENDINKVITISKAGISVGINAA
jgi:hypothetical protein